MVYINIYIYIYIYPIVGGSMLEPLMTLCNHEDVEVSRFACGALANIAESKRYIHIYIYI
jgi:hypothetical protein